MKCTCAFDRSSASAQAAQKGASRLLSSSPRGSVRAHLVSAAALVGAEHDGVLRVAVEFIQAIGQVRVVLQQLDVPTRRERVQPERRWERSGAARQARRAHMPPQLWAFSSLTEYWMTSDSPSTGLTTFGNMAAIAVAAPRACKQARAQRGSGGCVRTVALRLVLDLEPEVPGLDRVVAPGQAPLACGVQHPSDPRASANEPAARKQRGGSHQGSRSCWTPTRPSRRRPRRRSSRRTARRRPAAGARCACERRTGEADCGAAALAPLRRTKQAALEEKGKQRTWRETYAASSSAPSSARATDATTARPMAMTFIMATSPHGLQKEPRGGRASGSRPAR